MSDSPSLNEEELSQVYIWIDSLQLSKPKKNIARDFADGCMMAEVVSLHLPKLVEMHNYPQSHSLQQKQYNWGTLNLKVFKKLGFQLSKKDIDQIISCTPDAIEKVLRIVKLKIEKYIEQQKAYEQSQIEKAKQQNQALLQNQQNQLQQQIQISDPKILLIEKDGQIQELKETVEILELKIKKLEQLISLKDNKINSLINQLNVK